MALKYKYRTHAQQNYKPYSVVYDIRPTITGTPNDDNQLFKIPGIGSIMYVYMGITLDATLEAIRELRKIPDFQRHEGKRAINNLYKLVRECDDRMCRLAGDKDLAWLENTKDIFISEVESDILKYRISVNNIVNRCGYEGASSYAYAVVARSLARITSEWEEECIFGQLGKCAFVGNQALQTANAAKGYYRLYGTLQIEKAMIPIDRIYERNAQLNKVVEAGNDMQNINTGARIIVGKILDCERILAIANEQKNLSRQPTDTNGSNTDNTNL